MATIRHARPEDASAIAAIWNPVIRDTTATFNRVEKSAGEVAAAMAERTAAGNLWLVAEAPQGLVGFATYGQFRTGVGYRRTMEHTVILRANACGRGTGAALMQRLIAEAGERGVHVLVAGISGENAGAMRFHARLGFAEVGRMSEVGWKFDRWFDLVLMQKRL
jgi:L-amino acid N-acyltransferase